MEYQYSFYCEHSFTDPYNNEDKFCGSEISACGFQPVFFNFHVDHFLNITQKGTIPCNIGNKIP